MSIFCRRAAPALAILAALGLAPGCGRRGGLRAGDDAGARMDSARPGDAPVDGAAGDRAGDRPAEETPDGIGLPPPPPDASPDRPDSGSAPDLNPEPDLGGQPEAGQDQGAADFPAPADAGPEVSPDAGRDVVDPGCPAGMGDCTADIGCETRIDTDDNCGGCGQAPCALANTSAQCRNATPSCDEAICVPGYGNCDRGSGDCEAAYGAPAGTCLPKYKRTIVLPTQQPNVALAAGADGALFIGGVFTGSVDFDFTTGVDRRDAASGGSPFVTKVGAAGGYAWTRTFVTTGDANVVGLAVTADGGILGGGYFRGIIDLDPGTGTDYHTTLGYGGFIVKLTGDGAFVWGRAFEAVSDDGDPIIASLLAAADGSIYAGGRFSGQVDFDPGSGVDQRNGGPGSAFLVKLGADGTVSWVDVWENPASPGCVMQPSQFAVSPTGVVWEAGYYYLYADAPCDFDPGAGVDLKPPPLNALGTYVLTLDAAGSYLGTQTFGLRSDNASATPMAIVVDDQGAATIAGTFTGTVDFDPGPGETLRAVPYGGAFVAKLSAGGALQQLKVETPVSIAAIALGRGGSLLAAGTMFTAGSRNGVVQLPVDQSLGWTLPIGDFDSNTEVTRVVTTATGFFLGGLTGQQPNDFDPGPGRDALAGPGAFISEYAY